VYTVTGGSTQNTCTTVKTITVTVFDPVITIQSNPTVVCSGTPAILTAPGGDNYQWDNGFQGAVNSVTHNVNTTYTVTAGATSMQVTCNATATIQVNVNPNPTVMATSNRTLICRDEKTTLTANGASTYSWSTGAPGPTLSVLPQGITIHTYSVTGTDANGCTDQTTIQVRVMLCNGISEIKNLNGISVYPNPSNGTFSILTDTGADLELYSSTGQLLREIAVEGQNHTGVAVSGLSEGIYFLRDPENASFVYRIVVAK
jgi:hypothetical protein